MKLSENIDNNKDELHSIESIDFSTNTPKNVNIAVTPLKPGGANFKTHSLVKKSSSKYAYQPSVGGAAFSILFLSIGLIITIACILNIIGVFSTVKPVSWFMLLIGIIFATVGALLTYWSYMPRVFDKQLGLYYKAYKVDFNRDKNTSKKLIPLKSIIAIQIIGERITSDDGSYGSFELNLVLNDYSRKNVVDHGNLKSIINDAHILSDFLNIPIWHAKTHNAQ
ncbi:hypothetical protein [Gaetbulibacter jejuensis]|uniref:Uncharacterized protein n=1 Tax=Gaetbulibacter jejuensis TaxID=584607 RepID=A0ABN1JST5_9FLAO